MAKNAPLFTVVNSWRPDPLAWQSTCRYTLCTSIEEFRRALLSDALYRVMDFEATGLNMYHPAWSAVGLSLSTAPGVAMYLPMRHLVHPELNLPEREVMDIIAEADRRKLSSLWYNFFYDGQVCEVLGHPLSNWEDVQLAVWLSDSNQRVTGLKPTARRLLGIQMETFKETAAGVPHFGHLDPTVVYTYPCADADLPGRIWRLPAIQEALESQRYIYALEKRVLPIVWRGLRSGCFLDPEALRQIRQETSSKIDDARLTVYARAEEGWERRVEQISQVENEPQRQSLFDMLGPRPTPENFNLASTPQIARMLVDVCGVPIIEKTETGQPATGGEVLAAYAEDYPICAAITKLREFTALQNNYVDKLVRWVDEYGPAAAFAFNTMGAPTGRMSSSGDEEEGTVPLNVQSTPEPDKHPDKPNLRVAFTANQPNIAEADREWVFVSIDYSQIEMRVAGNLSREDAWIKAFNEGVDIHIANARLAYGDQTLQRGTPEGEEARGRGKTMGFAVLYQAGVDTVAKHGGISAARAEEMISTFFRNTPKLNTWIAGTKSRAKGEGFITTAYGRVRWLREYYARGASRAMEEQGNREAVNTAVQGTAADILKLAIVKIDAMLRNRGWEQDCFQFMWVHDEINFRVRRSKQLEIVPELVRTMEFEIGGTNGTPRWPIPLVAEASVGWSWGDLRKTKEPL